jgi:hypothetical protein
MTFHPVDEIWLSAILSQLDENVCICNEKAQSVEFKESFNLANLAEYARTMAAFANNSGGYLVLGVRDTPREIVGLTSDRFAEVDPAEISTRLNQLLDPALIWRSGTVDHKQKCLGYIHVAEARRKPVVCRQTKNPLREGAVYYRYPGETKEIRYSELATILEQDRLATDNKWIGLLSQIATVGIDNSAVLNLESGEVSGPRGAMFIPAELLPRLQFVREGQFVEKMGAPTLKLIGEVQIAPLSSGVTSDSRGASPEIIHVPTQIGATDVIKRFLTS